MRWQKWCLYYAPDWAKRHGRETFSELDGEPWESPTEGVVLVAQFEHIRWTDVLNNAYVYIYRDGFWSQAGDEVGLRDQLALYAREIECVRYGFWMEREKFRAIATRGREEVNELRRAAGLME